MINDYFVENIKTIRSKAPGTADQIERAGESSYKAVETKSGDLTLLVPGKAGTQVYLHSRYNPVKESKRIVENAVDKDSDIVVIGGFGLGYLPEAALELTSPETAVVIIENDPAILHAAFSCRDMSKILQSGRVDFVLAENVSEITSLLDLHATRKTALIIHRPSYDLNRDFYSNLHSVLYSYINSKEVNIATLSRFEKLWTRNLLRNIDIYRNNPGVQQLKGTAEQIPALVVGAGPSLQKQLNLIRGSSDKFLIIAVDTVYNVLTAHGITPDFVVAVDPQLINCQYLRGIQNRGTTLVADAGSYPALFKLFDGKIFLSAAPFPIVNWFTGYFGNKGVLSSGGSVSTSAFDLALQMGCNPIILVGQDLAYSSERLHVRGTIGEEIWENSCTRTKPLTLRFTGFLNRNKTVKLPAWGNQNEVWSDRKFLTFLWWFEKKISTLNNTVEVFNATEGGALIKGSVEKRLIEIVERLPVINRPVSVKEYSDNTGNVKKDAFRSDACAIIAWLNRVADSSAESVSLCRELLYGQTGQMIMKNPIEQMDKTDRLIQNSQWGYLLSSTLQKVIHTVNEGFSLTDSSNDDKKDPLKESLKLYSSIKDAAEELSGWLKKYLQV